MNDNQYAGQDAVGAVQGMGSAQQPFTAPAPVAPNTPQIDPATLPFNQYVGQGSANGFAQPLPPQAQNGRWVPIDTPVTGIPSGVNVGQPVQGADGQIYCYGPGSAEFGSMSSNGVRPIATPSDIIQLPPIVQPIAMVPYTTMNQPLLQYNAQTPNQQIPYGNHAPSGAQGFGGPQLAQQQLQMQQQMQMQQQQMQMQQQMQQQQQYQQPLGQPEKPALAPAYEPLPRVAKAYRGLSFVIMLLALGALAVTLVLEGITGNSLINAVIGLFDSSKPFYRLASSQVGYYAYAYAVALVVECVLFLVAAIQNLVYMAKGKNPRCVSVLAIISFILALAAGAMVYCINLGIDSGFTANDLVSFTATYSFGPAYFVALAAPVVLFILPFFARKDAYFAPPLALGAGSEPTYATRSY